MSVVSRSPLLGYVGDILSVIIEFAPPSTALIVADRQCELAKMLCEAYAENLPESTVIDFDAVSASAVLQEFETLRAGDLVVLIQSSSFRLEAFRIRVELFKRGLKVIEHPHLGRIDDDQIPHYIASLAYDPTYYRGVGAALKAKIDVAEGARVHSGNGEVLEYRLGFEPAKLNVGDYSQLANVGGQFPVGEVFTEPKQLESVNGRVRIFAFGDMSFRVNAPERPITLVIAQGRVRQVIDSTPQFDDVIAKIVHDEGEVWVRELGFGMNRAFSRERRVWDIGSYERMCGIHLSLGAKHGLYKKPSIKHKEARCHVDVFPVSESVELDGEVIFRDGGYCVDILR